MSDKSPQRRRLEGWKQIAAYHRVTINTVRRWAHELDMPVHPVGSANRPRYHAWTDEMDAWAAVRERELLPGRQEESVLQEVGDETGTGPPLERRKLIRRWIWTAAAILLASLPLATAHIFLATRSETLEAAALSLVGLKPHGVAVIGAEGELLWWDPGLARRRSALAVLRRGQDPVVVTIPLHDGEDLDHNLLLQIRDVRTGGLLGSGVRLEGGQRFFLEFSETYAPWVHAGDFDQDGVDEVLITYLHFPNYPSFTVLYEPKTASQRLLYVSTGHHYYAGSVDLDDDGRAELIFETVNNLMGWYTGVAAVVLEPALGIANRPAQTAFSPDHDFGGETWRALKWYALTPGGHCYGSPGCFVVDHEERRIQVLRRTSFELSFEGFDPNLATGLELATREPQRRQAFDALRDATRLPSAGFSEQAVARAEKAVECAESIGDEYLLQWAHRVLVSSLIAAGETDQAHTQLDSLRWQHPELEAQLVYEAAVAHHLADDLEWAATFYEQGFGVGATSGPSGRPKWEFLRGLILSLGEAERWKDAEAQLARHGGLESSPWSWALADHLALLRDEPTSFDLESEPDYNEDLIRYWRLEAGRRRGFDRGRLLRMVEDEHRSSSETRPLLLALRAAILYETGQKQDAALAIREALQRTLEGARRSIVLKAHLARVRSIHDEILQSTSGRSESQVPIRQTKIVKEGQEPPIELPEP